MLGENLTDFCREILETHGFADVGSGSGAEATIAVLGASQSREGQNGQGVEVGVGPELPDCL